LDGQRRRLEAPIDRARLAHEGKTNTCVSASDADRGAGIATPFTPIIGPRSVGCWADTRLGFLASFQGDAMASAEYVLFTQPG
jgi:hypothetical protein